MIVYGHRDDRHQPAARARSRRADAAEPRRDALGAHPPAQPVAPARRRAGGAERDHGVRRGHDGVDQGRRAREPTTTRAGRAPPSASARCARRWRSRRSWTTRSRRCCARSSRRSCSASAALLVIDGQLAIGSLVAFQTLLTQFGAPVARDRQLLVAAAERAEPHPPARRRARRARRPDLRPGGPAPGLHATARRDSTARSRSTASASASSRRSPPLIEDFDLSLEPGARVAIVGASGSGKSTLVRLIAGLHEPWSGRCCVDGRHRHEIPRRVLANSIAMVDQSIALFAGTVRDNLTLWDDAVADDAVVRAGVDAQIHDDIVEPRRRVHVDAWRTAGRTGAAASASGSRSRARSCATRRCCCSTRRRARSTPTPRPPSSPRCGAAAARLSIVAHRLSTVRDADLILVIDKGKVVERGTPRRSWWPSTATTPELVRE